ncbi:hypothetical protein [Flavobacterium sp.]|uniref:hypothetical protein n=1 Tax=Flavobacterium sp. TaxID=239 RepID=UPI0031D6C2D0
MNIKGNKIELFLTSIGLIICFYIIILAITQTCQNNIDIDNNEFTTIGMVYKYEEGRRVENYKYKYYYNRKLYQSEINTYGFGGAKCINHFYTVKLSSKNPHNSEILLEKEIIDNYEILNSGFRP